MPLDGRLHPMLSLERERLGDDRHSKDSGSSSRLRDHRCRTSPGAASHARRYETHVCACKVIHDFIDQFFGGCLTNLRQGACPQAFGHKRTQLDQSRCLRHRKRLSIGVRNDELGALQAFRDHVVDGIPAAATDADDRQIWPHFADFGLIRGGHGIRS